MTNEPNLDLLTKAERAKYERYSHINNLTIREQFRSQSWAYFALSIWAVLTIILWMVFASAEHAEAAGTGTRGEKTAALTMLLIVMLGGGAGVIVIAKRTGTQALKRGREAFLERIGYADRVKSISNDDYHSPTRRQTQHAWYQGHSELNWQDRVRAENYGMDVDSYINNVAEHDKD